MKPINYWTYENCKVEALKYHNRVDFRIKSSGAYYSSRKNGWLEEICSHIINKKKTSNYWTYDKCKEEALKYKTTNEFKLNSVGAYGSSKRNGWMVKICLHMIQKKNSSYWENIENCKNEASKYKNRGEFKSKSNLSFKISRKNGWLNIVSPLTNVNAAPNNYWIYERCKKEALKYSTRSEFKRKSIGAYAACLRNKWDDELFSHMIRIGNRYLKCVYVYEFSDNCAYVGLTYNMESRTHDRNKTATDSVTKHIKETGIKNPTLKLLTDYINVDEAVILEEKYVKEYKNNGWCLLNSAKTGSVGSVRKWNKEKCLNVALRCKTYGEFSKNFSGAYQCACTNGWLNEICSHLTRKNKKGGYWTKELCKLEFLKYKTLKEIRLNSKTAYSKASKNGWLSELNSHMIRFVKSRGYWTKERCLEEALKHFKKTEFRKKNGSTYVIACKNGWLNDICSHMIKKEPKL